MPPNMIDCTLWAGRMSSTLSGLRTRSAPRVGDLRRYLFSAFSQGRVAPGGGTDAGVRRRSTRTVMGFAMSLASGAEGGHQALFGHCE